jgi:4-hydroxy-4-methyl-2-oxoglutarate aldolase
VRGSPSETLAALPVATICDAGGGAGLLPAWIRQQAPGIRCGGPALPVACDPEDNLAIHEALAIAERGAVIVAAIQGGGEPRGLWGEIASAAGRKRGVSGFVTDGHVRDLDELAGYGVGVFARGPAPLKAAKRAAARFGAVELGGVTVHPGDVVAGDADGIVVVPAADVERVAATASRLLEAEREIRAGLSAGRTTLELLQLTDRATEGPKWRT